jgi:hypothetical protein
MFKLILGWVRKHQGPAGTAVGPSTFADLPDNMSKALKKSIKFFDFL